jgi:serine/threonine protein kinase
LTRHRRKLIDDLFLGAVELPPSQRPAFLAQSCPDERLVNEVESLLRFDRPEPGFEDVVQQSAVSLISNDSLIGVRLGPYRITEEIGKGGMGAVFLAIRDDHAFEKKVAIKVVKRGMDSDAVLDRFRDERRILANLNHPYISHLIDAGTTPDGRPYFVMEYVPGEPVTAYAASHNLGLPAILELFRKICDAVSYAHRNLVIHRDLKASNILVAGDVPKLLDFGIAKLLDPRSPSTETAPSSRMLTLDCASPEQVRGDAVTTSTDIYSLGLLLYQLLTGHLPWDFSNASFAEAANRICAAAPPKPGISNDLDNIVLMALRKDPSRRYRTVDEFSEDIRRYQAGLPVIAREDSFSYRASKFLRRHRVAALLAAISVAGLMAGMIDANVERRRAEVRLNQMLGMANQTLLDLQTQVEHQPGATEARLRITQSTLTYLAGLANEAGNNQDVRTTLATAYLRTGDIQGRPDAPNMGESDAALASYAKAEKLFDPADHVNLSLLLYHRGEILCGFGRIPECLATLQRGLNHAEKSDRRDALLTAAGIYHRMAYVLTQSKPEEALANSRLEMEIYTKLAQREPDNVEVLDGLASSYSTTGGALNRRGRLEESLALYRKGLAIREQIVAKHPNDVALRRNLMISYGRIGDVLGNPSRKNLGDKAGALANFQKAQAIAESLVAADPKNSLARMDLVQVRTRVATVMDESGQIRDSLALLDAAREGATSMEQGKGVITERVRLLALIDEYRGRRLSYLNDSGGAIAAFRYSIEEAQLGIKKDPTDSSALMQVILSSSALALELSGAGLRDEALRYANDARSRASLAASSGPDPVSMSIYVPRSSMWLGDTYQALARRKDTSPAQRHADWAAAVANYSRATEEWQKLHGRADFFRYRAEIDACSKKAAECNHKASSGV